MYCNLFQRIVRKPFSFFKTKVKKARPVKTPFKALSLQPVKKKLAFSDIERIQGNSRNKRKITTNINSLALVPSNHVFNTSSVLTKR
jgi:hypothetical protein